MQQLILVISSGILVWAFAQRSGALAQSTVEPAAPLLRAASAAPLRAPAPAPLQFEAAIPVTAPDDAARRAQTLDRYIAARFPGIVSNAAALGDVKAVVAQARLLFLDERHDDAQELLQLAIPHTQAPRALELARLEITFLQGDAERYVALARAYEAAYPANPEWDAVARLGKALMPSEPLFANGGRRSDDHYGPWPDTPNWIQASWDLTPEVLAGEFHQAMREAHEMKGTA